MIFPVVDPLLVKHISYLTVMIFPLVGPLLVINISYLTVMVFPLVGPLLSYTILSMQKNWSVLLLAEVTYKIQILSDLTVFPLVGPLLVINKSYLTVVIFSLVDPQIF
jgi:hypothetical protein